MAAEKSEIFLVISLLVIFLLVIFGALLTLAGNVQTLYGSNIELMDVASTAAAGHMSIGESIMDAFVLSMSFGVLGPPLSLGVSMLGLINSSWWLNGWMQLYIFFVIIGGL